jgi:4'-phosphopantetheinyl transferase EntD
VDVEPISRRCTEARETFSTDAEVERIRDFFGPSFSEDEAYTRLFSAKEAAAKCMGTHMYFAFHHYRLIRIDENGPVQRWTLKDRSTEKDIPAATSAVYRGHVVSNVSADPLNRHERSAL